MEENKKSPFEGFQEILEQQHSNAIGNINNVLYNDIFETAKIVENNNEELDLGEILGNLRERFKNEDLNQVTEIFIYSQSFLSTNEDPLPMTSQLCISIGKLFTNKNLHYTASKVYSKDEIEGGCALSFLVYLAMHEQHTSYILSFIKENFEGFSQNEKTKCVFQLRDVLPDNEIAAQIVKNSGITKYELTFSTEVESISRPITFQIENSQNNTKVKVEEQNLKNEEPIIKVEEPSLKKKNVLSDETKSKKWFEFWK
ncbi:MAG: hypothetical protein J7574_10695 [Flavobacterium sp.]|uniref:hypothetical protein n=1 Tax=Flavobacterium sp. TaxID=239 RepID=UPI001B2C2962|nr:hypothetical protein [Flavobacterium sp.]MBO9584613.1 hypothetical protein [Flavobacterium sp.]